MKALGLGLMIAAISCGSVNADTIYNEGPWNVEAIAGFHGTPACLLEVGSSDLTLSLEMSHIDARLRTTFPESSENVQLRDDKWGFDFGTSVVGWDGITGSGFSTAAVHYSSDSVRDLLIALNSHDRGYYVTQGKYIPLDISHGTPAVVAFTGCVKQLNALLRM